MRRRLAWKVGLLTISVLALIFLRPKASAQEPITLESVLKTMDATAANFSTAQADFVFDQYQKVVDEHDIQKGTVYYRRAGQQIEMMAEFKEPDRKFVLYRGAKLQIYQPKIEQVTEYSAGANQQELESFLVLGFGGSGQDLKKAFDVSYEGEETVAGIKTARLQLIPKSEKVRNNFPQITLWIDLERGISVQQRLLQTQGDYRLAQYSGIKIPAKFGTDVFHLKTTGKTKFVSPQG